MFFCVGDGEAVALGRVCAAGGAGGCGATTKGVTEGLVLCVYDMCLRSFISDMDSSACMALGAGGYEAGQMVDDATSPVFARHLPFLQCSKSFLEGYPQSNESDSVLSGYIINQVFGRCVVCV